MQTSELLTAELNEARSRIAALERSEAKLREALIDIRNVRPREYDQRTLLRFSSIVGDIVDAALADGKEPTP